MIIILSILLVILAIITLILWLLFMKVNNRLKAIQDNLIFDTKEMKQIYDCLEYHGYISVGEIKRELECRTHIKVSIKTLVQNLQKLEEKGCLDKIHDFSTTCYRKLI